MTQLHSSPGDREIFLPVSKGRKKEKEVIKEEWEKGRDSEREREKEKEEMEEGRKEERKKRRK